MAVATCGAGVYEAGRGRAGNAEVTVGAWHGRSVRLPAGDPVPEPCSLPPRQGASAIHDCHGHDRPAIAHWNIPDNGAVHNPTSADDDATVAVNQAATTCTPADISV